MTTRSAFTQERSSAATSVVLSGSREAVTMRGSLLSDITGNITFVPWPAGTQEGDLAVIIASSGWDFTANIANEIRMEYRGGGGTPVSGWAFSFTVTADQITAGGVTLTCPNASSGAIGVATFDGSQNPSASLLWSQQFTTATAPFPMYMGYGANDTYLMFSAIETNTTISFANHPMTHTITGRPVCSVFGVLANPASLMVNDVVTFGANAQNYTAAVRVSRGAPKGGLTATAVTACNAAAGTRQISGMTYFEAKIEALVGTMGVGFVNIHQNRGVIALGTTTNNFVYQNDGLVRLNNVTLATLAAFTTGDRVSVAYHPGSKQVWFKVNTGSWNNDGTADPAAQVGGIDVSAYDPVMAFPAASFSALNGVITLTLAAEDFLYTPPVGYRSMETDTFSIPIIDTSPRYSSIEMTHNFGFVHGEPPVGGRITSFAMPAGPLKTVAGAVQENGVGVEGKRVLLYNKRTGSLLGEAFTNADGNFVLPSSEPDAPHFVVAFDDPEYNAKVFDNVVPG